MSARQQGSAVLATLALIASGTTISSGTISSAAATPVADGPSRAVTALTKPSKAGAIKYVAPVDVWGGKTGAVVKANQVNIFQRPKGAHTPLSGQAVILHFTVKNAKQAGTVTMWPVTEGRPTTPVIAFPKGNSSTSTVVRLCPEHKVKFVSSATVTFHVSVYGWITGPADAKPGPGGTQVVRPFALLNATAKGRDKVRSGGDWVTLQATGKNGIPKTGVRAVWLAVQTTSKKDASLYLSTPDHEWEELRGSIERHWTTKQILARVDHDGRLCYKLAGAAKPQVRLVVIGWVAEATATDIVSTMTGGLAPVEARVVPAKAVKVPAKYKATTKVWAMSLAKTSAVPANAPEVMIRLTIKTKRAGFIEVGSSVMRAIKSKTKKVRLLSNTEVQVIGQAPIGKDRKIYFALPKSAKLISWRLQGYAVKPLTLPAAPAGSVWAWGDNAHGSLGNGSTELQSPVPGRVRGLRDIVAIDSGVAGGRALGKDGAVWTWGGNSSGQLGDGTTYSSPVPVRVKRLPAAKAIAGGATSTYAVARDGTVWAWGSNSAGRLGNGTTTNSTTPVQVKNLTNITAVAVDDGTAYALDATGAVWGWGDNANNELGNSSGKDSYIPVKVPGLSHVTQIAAGPQNGYALTAAGDVYAWGANWYNQITTSTVETYRPTRVNGLPKIASISAYAEGAYGVARDGTLWGWGGHDTPQRPWQVPDVGDIIEVSPYSTDMVYALQRDGTVWAWGDNTYGQLGDGTTNYAKVPRRVIGLKHVKAVVHQTGAGAYALTR